MGGTGGADGDGMNIILYVFSLCGCRLQVFLNTYGIQTQTPQQVEPIQIWPQKELVKVKLVGHMLVRAFLKSYTSLTCAYVLLLCSSECLRCSHSY